MVLFLLLSSLSLPVVASLSQPDQALVDKLRNLQAQEKAVKKELRSKNIVIKGKGVFILTPVGVK